MHIFADSYNISTFRFRRFLHTMQRREATKVNPCLTFEFQIPLKQCKCPNAQAPKTQLKYLWFIVPLRTKARKYSFQF